ncbi:MAG: helix-turn-helix domain-containing protein [Anaerolineae bacterium]|nr:helix-turn-helix domain-containing protein [Anaerolineae bacterium]
MSLILFVIGVALYFTGRFSLGSVRTAGRHVKAAGAILMMPASGAFFLSFVAGILFGGSDQMLLAVIGLLGLLELASMVAAVAVAYILIADPPNAPRLPGILAEIQAQRRGQTPTEQNPSAPRKTVTVRKHPLDVPGVPARPQTPRGTYGSILNIRQAAEYMGVTEGEILNWIEAGKLAAARGNMGYAIARSLLDEMRADKRPDTVQPA